MSDRDDAGRFLPGHSIPGPGRPSDYDPSMNDAARKLALLGLTDGEIATFFGVCEDTLNAWKHAFPAFSESLNAGKVIADAEVAASLYQRAIGEVTWYERVIRTAQGEETIKLSKREAADPGAAKLWLTNRQGAKWRDKQTVEHGSDPERPVMQKVIREVVYPPKAPE